MERITVIHVRGDEYVVAVQDETSDTKHRVTVTAEDLEWLGTEAPAERVLEESFRFLLEREPKEAILRRFDLPVIARYFPDYPEEIRRRLED